MPRLTSYACDKCNEVTEFEDLCPVTVYVFRTALDDPKILEFELVCLDCREQFVEVIKGWLGEESTVPTS